MPRLQQLVDSPTGISTKNLIDLGPFTDVDDLAEVMEKMSLPFKSVLPSKSSMLTFERAKLTRILNGGLKDTKLIM